MEPIKTTSIRLPAPLWKLLKRWCLDNDTSMQQIIEYLIREHLRNTGKTRREER